jgi:hypothetical protein
MVFSSSVAAAALTLAVAQGGPTPAPAAEAPAAAPAPPPVFPPTYSNTPTPLGDFPGPAFGPYTPDRMPLMDLLQGTWYGSLLDSERMQITGWTDVAYTASTVRHLNLPLGFNYRANEGDLQQNVLRVERPVDTGSKQFDWGFRVDLLFGIDYRYPLARGLFFGQLVPHNRLYGYDPTDFYVDLWFPEVGQGTELRVGRFVCTGGEESAISLTNILFSRTYINIFTPFTHTGAVAFTKLSDAWYVHYGVVVGNDVFLDPTDQPTFVGGVKWVSGDKADSLWFTCYVNGGNYFGTRQRDNVQFFDLVYTHVFTPRFQIISEATFNYMTRVPGLDTVTWYGVDAFFQYDFTPRLYGAIRPEIWVDSEGQRTGFKGLYTTLTAGVTYKPVKWLFLRPELRWDHCYGAQGPYEGKHSIGVAAMDVLVRW